MTTILPSAVPTAPDRESVNGFRGFGLITFEEYRARVLAEGAKRAGEVSS